MFIVISFSRYLLVINISIHRSCKLNVRRNFYLNIYICPFLFTSKFANTNREGVLLIPHILNFPIAIFSRFFGTSLLISAPDIGLPRSMIILPGP